MIITDEVGCDLGVLDEVDGYQFFPRHWVAKRLDLANAGGGVFAVTIATIEKKRYIQPRTRGRNGPEPPPDTQAPAR